VRDAELSDFDVLIAAPELPVAITSAASFSEEFYRQVQRRLSADGVFCQRFRQHDFGPDPVRLVMATMADSFSHVAAVQSVPGEVVLLATNSESGLFDQQLLSRLQLDHVRREIDTTGWDWVQVAGLPVLDVNDPIGVFQKERPHGTRVANGHFVLSTAFEAYRRADKGEEVRATLGPHSVRLSETIRQGPDHEEMKRRESAIVQQIEILSGMPDQQLTYRRSLRMELQKSPRTPVRVVEAGEVRQKRNPLDEVRVGYFISLGQAIQSTEQFLAAPPDQQSTDLRQQTVNTIQQLEPYTRATEPLLSYFAHLEMVRLYEAIGHPLPTDEFRHRLHTVFYSVGRDTSVRPVMSAIDQLLETPDLVADSGTRYDLMNGMLQKLVERWHARIGMEPRSAKETQADVERSIRLAGRAMGMLDELSGHVGVRHSDLVQRRRYVVTALITPLHRYNEEVLLHRIGREAQQPTSQDAGDDLPLLIQDDFLSTN
ncbi:MAG: hypothetical protein KDA96_08340, partial [Planctomycetaceae bacterium]|nr:hypothetical protein [Planctomycetaceae bacterium]